MSSAEFAKNILNAKVDLLDPLWAMHVQSNFNGSNIRGTIVDWLQSLVTKYVFL